ncbi:hypothetical protein DE146DRAFT_631017 [Phaeosphaeria sp. MPI-PUGE-AT-0046c]|nr:hypothetical protein DE146DRAFT_631017 [Phaeosphaeria sp. MPI-PUGE-AT-0046c]
MATHLLDLPAEVLTMIFGHLWNASMQDAIDQEPTWIRSINVFVDCCQSASQRKSSDHARPMAPTHALPGWLRTCKTVLHGALNLLARRGRIYIGSVMSSSDVDKDRAEDMLVHHDFCEIGCYNNLVGESYEMEVRNCKDWYANSALPGILASSTPHRLVADFPASSSSLISPLEPWLEEEIVLCRDLFSAFSKIHNIKQWILTFNCAIAPLKDEAWVELLHLGLLLQGVRGDLDHLEVFFALGKEDTRSEKDLLEIESMLWGELQTLQAWALTELKIVLSGGVKKARVYVDNELRGWNIVWIRCTEDDDA